MGSKKKLYRGSKNQGLFNITSKELSSLKTQYKGGNAIGTVTGKAHNGTPTHKPEIIKESTPIRKIIKETEMIQDSPSLRKTHKTNCVGKENGNNVESIVFWVFVILFLLWII